MGRASSGILVTGGLLARRPGRSGARMTPPGEAPFCPSIYAPSGDKETLTIAAKVKVSLRMHTLVEVWAWEKAAEELTDRGKSPWDHQPRRPAHDDKRKAP